MTSKENLFLEGESEKKSQRTVVAQACDYCRKRKVKCDGELPCAVCKLRNQECSFLLPIRKRGPSSRKS
jgi:hypothetical protein